MSATDLLLLRCCWRSSAFAGPVPYRADRRRRGTRGDSRQRYRAARNVRRLFPGESEDAGLSRRCRRARGKHGAVILIHEWDGLGERVRQVADAFAAEGYVALAADLYSGRTGANPGREHGAREGDARAIRSR